MGAGEGGGAAPVKNAEDIAILESEAVGVSEQDGGPAGDGDIAGEPLSMSAAAGVAVMSVPVLFQRLKAVALTAPKLISPPGPRGEAEDAALGNSGKAGTARFR